MTVPTYCPTNDDSQSMYMTTNPIVDYYTTAYSSASDNMTSYPGETEYMTSYPGESGYFTSVPTHCPTDDYSQPMYMTTNPVESEYMTSADSSKLLICFAWILLFVQEYERLFFFWTFDLVFYLLERKNF